MSYISSEDTDDATSSVYSAKVSTRSSRKPNGCRGVGSGEAPPVNFVWVSGKGHVCNNCKKEFRTKSQWTKHELYCKQLETIRGENVDRGGGGGGGGSGSSSRNTVTPSNQELFAIIQDLTLKYNKVNDELNELKKWAKKAGTIATNNGVVGIIPFSVTRHKKQMVEDILNRYYIADKDCTFRKWYTKPETFAITNDDLALVFSRDLVDGISNVVNRVVYNAWYKNGSFELGEEDATNTEYIPFRPYEQKSGMFHVFEVPYKQLNSNNGLYDNDNDNNDNHTSHFNGYNHSGSDQEGEHGHMYNATPPSWRFIENEEYNDFISHIHKRFLKKFKEWQDVNMELQQKMSITMVSSSSSGEENDSDGYVNKHVEANDVPLSEEFSTLYNRNADKVMGGNVPILKLYARIREKITFKQVCNYTGD